MSFLSDEERRRLQRFLEKSANFAAEYPDLNRLLESYAEPMRSFVETVIEIDDDWESIKNIPRERKDEIDGLVDRIDRTIVRMDEYKTRVIEVDLVQLRANVEEEYVEIIDETSNSIKQILSETRKGLKETRAACIELKKRLNKRVVDVN